MSVAIRVLDGQGRLYVYPFLHWSPNAHTENSRRGAASVFVLQRSHVQMLLRVSAVINEVFSAFISLSVQMRRYYIQLGH
jgi:hypothetical protein